MTNIELVEKKIENIIKKSAVIEDPFHSKNTLEWLLRLYPDADEGLRIAALGHDIERAISGRKVRRIDYPSYDLFKQAHALNSARILKEIMLEYKLNEKIIQKVFYLVENHETGADKMTNLLKDADSISFFDVNLPLYYARNPLENTKMRISWGYKRLSPNMKSLVKNFYYKDEVIENLVKQVST